MSTYTPYQRQLVANNKAAHVLRFLNQTAARLDLKEMLRGLVHGEYEGVFVHADVRFPDEAFLVSKPPFFGTFKVHYKRFNIPPKAPGT